MMSAPGYKRGLSHSHNQCPGPRMGVKMKLLLFLTATISLGDQAAAASFGHQTSATSLGDQTVITSLDEVPLNVRRCWGGVVAKGDTENVYSFVTFSV